ncbi:MAG: amidinotransferase [Ferruginibacter sp.]|nr:amidinotransferase [Ferruginibacter sp.]
MFASHVAMMRPAAFGYNKETAENNEFQQTGFGTGRHLQQQAIEAFNRLKFSLERAGVTVHEMADTLLPPKPDAVFLNNWFACESGAIVLFPMEAESRRTESREDIVFLLKEITGIQNVIDWRHYTNESKFLEGTGSIVPDRVNRIAYACYSSRTNKDLFLSYCSQFHYKPLLFSATSKSGQNIYHTNVMLCIGQTFAIICSEAIQDKSERENVLSNLQNTGHTLLEISYNQMHKFCGNMLALENRQGCPVLVMSTKAYNSLTPDQLVYLNTHTTIISADIDIIEQVGGGGVRCMLAELFMHPL